MPRDRTKTYATLHRLRKMEEDARARESAAAHHALARGLQLRAALEQTRKAALDGAAERMAAPEIDASDMRAYYQYERHLARAMDRQDAENQKLDRSLAEKRLKHNEAAVKRKIVERLSEREGLRRAETAARNERIKTDESASVRALLAMRKGGKP